MRASQSFSAQDLASALVAIHVVVNAFIAKSPDDWSNVVSQGRFAQMVESLRMNEFGPSETYLKRLVRHYVSCIEAESPNQVVEDDKLLSLIFHFSMNKEANTIPPDPLQSCYVSFRIPEIIDRCNTNTNTNNTNLVRFRVFPRHNDVALKVWEAGACLAEFLLWNPNHVAGKNCCEFGSGVGLTGTVVAGCCHPSSYLMTDYTEACLMNIHHNIVINQAWLRERIATFSSGGMITHVSGNHCHVFFFFEKETPFLPANSSVAD